MRFVTTPSKGALMLQRSTFNKALSTAAFLDCNKPLVFSTTLFKRSNSASPMFFCFKRLRPLTSSRLLNNNSE